MCYLNNCVLYSMKGYIGKQLTVNHYKINTSFTVWQCVILKVFWIKNTSDILTQSVELSEGPLTIEHNMLKHFLKFKFTVTIQNIKN